MSIATKKILAYAPAAFFLVLDIWAFSTGTYASDRDRILPYYFAFLCFAYMLPSIIAAHRNHSHFLALWLVNLIGGFVFCLGWFAAVIWAFIDPARKETVTPTVHAP